VEKEKREKHGAGTRIAVTVPTVHFVVQEKHLVVIKKQERNILAALCFFLFHVLVVLHRKGNRVSHEHNDRVRHGEESTAYVGASDHSLRGKVLR
jgi:uncharacterized membrane protein